MADELFKGAPHPLHDPSYPDHRKFPGLPEHFSILSAQNSHTHNQEAHHSMHEELKHHGFTPVEVKGHYGHEEKSYLVEHKGTPEHKAAIEHIAHKYDQEAVIHHDKGENELKFGDGRPSWKGKGVSHGPHITSHFTQLPSGHRFQLNVSENKVKKSDDKPYDLLLAGKKKEDEKVSHPHHYGVVDGVNVFQASHESHDSLPGHHVKDPDDKALEDAIEFAIENKHPSVVIHGNPPPMLRDSAPQGAHPHAYDWHDGHSDHYADSDDVAKAEAAIPPPASAAVKEPHHGNSQAAAVGVSTYRPIAEHYGKVVQGHKSNLQFYRGIERHEPKIDKMISDAGYQTYFSGGKHGRPDLKAKNYNTGHLMIWDPTPGSGGDFNDEAHTRTWRKVHELSHALTYPEVNQLYGEGRRLGKMGVRTPRESKRAVHWEWLAAHKQRELSEKMGHKISNEDFHKELNTVMHDAVHRAVTGQFAEPSDEGFVPSSEKIPLEHSLKLIDEHAKHAGLEHEEATFRSTGVPREISEGYRAVAKSEGLSGELKQGGKIKKFYLWRAQDESGVSGTGRVAEGVVFSNGWVGMNWLTRWGSLAFYPSINDVMQVHGHAGKTTVVYEDCSPEDVHLISNKTPEEAGVVQKAFLQGDGETMTDPTQHSAAVTALPQWLMDWGAKNLVPMEKDGHAEFSLAGKTIKVRKVLEDLYTGWIEHEGHIIHQFEKITMPLVLSQLQSKLELYANEEPAVSDKPEVKPGDVVETPAEQAKEEKELGDISGKLKELQQRVEQLRQDEIKEHQESISGKELAEGIENPESECAACERPSDQCVCYLNLPKPRIEVTDKGINIFFKSEWQEEDIANFKNDLSRRAGNILRERRVQKAKDLLARIRKK